MKTPIRILGIAGSLRRELYNRATLRAATKLVPEDAILETFEIDGIPPFNQDSANRVTSGSVICGHDSTKAIPVYKYCRPFHCLREMDWSSRSSRSNSNRPAGRHEMLHETNRRDVITNLLVWISGILEKGA